MLKFREQKYWKQYCQYQTFNSVEELRDNVKKIMSTFELPKNAENVLNTIKLHANMFFGVCWLKVDEIAKKSKVSSSTVHRMLTILKDANILKVINVINDRKGGKAHNVYVINPFEALIEGSFDVSNDTLIDTSFDRSEEDFEQPSIPYVASDSASSDNVYKNVHSNSHSNVNTNFNKNSHNEIFDNVVDNDTHVSLKSEKMNHKIPEQFFKLFSTFHSADVIADRWKSTCVALKNTVGYSKDNLPWDAIETALKRTINKLKLRRLKDSSDNTVGGYYYRTLVDCIKTDQEPTYVPLPDHLYIEYPDYSASAVDDDLNELLDTGTLDSSIIAKGKQMFMQICSKPRGSLLPDLSYL